MKLYQSNGSPNSRRVRIFVAEKGITLSTVPVDLGSKEQLSDAYRAINPHLVVPTLVLDDGTAIGEVPAIWRYLEAAFAERPLLGTSPTQQAQVTMWERRAEQEGFAAVMEAVRNSVPGLKGRAVAGPHDYEQIPELAARSRIKIGNFYDDLNRQLATQAYVAGSEFSAADITALVTVDFATAAARLPIPDGHDALRRWYALVAARPSTSA